MGHSGQASLAPRARLLTIVTCVYLSGCDGPGRNPTSSDSATSEVAESIAIADLNGDRMKDIVVGYTLVGREGYTNGFASVILRDPASPNGFRRSVDAELGQGNIPWSVVAADLDGSGPDDVAIATGANGMRIYAHDTGNSGPLTRATNVSYLGVPFGMTAADLNGDGAIDIAMTGSDRRATDALILFWQSLTPRGTFTQSNAILPTADNATALASADMNGDGRMDLVTSSRATPNSGLISIHLQSDITAGTFLPRVDFATGASPESLTLADLNGDGLIDVAVVNRRGDTESGVEVLLQDSTRAGVLTTPTAYSTGRWATAVAAGDLNRDDRIDLVVTHASEQGSSLSVLLQSDVQTGTFLPAKNYALNCAPREAAIEDVNSDQLPDVALACGQRATLLMNIAGMPGALSSPVSVGR